MSSVDIAFQKALEIQNKAYAPYSKFKVGAVIKIKGKDLYYSGCNIENASYGATVCAERTALFKMVTESIEPIEFLLLITDTDSPATPCGLCLQVMSEFIESDTPVWLCTPKGEKKQLTFKDLFPQPFNKSHLG